MEKDWYMIIGMIIGLLIGITFGGHTEAHTKKEVLLVKDGEMVEEFEKTKRALKKVKKTAKKIIRRQKTQNQLIKKDFLSLVQAIKFCASMSDTNRSPAGSSLGEFILGAGLNVLSGGTYLEELENSKSENKEKIKCLNLMAKTLEDNGL